MNCLCCGKPILDGKDVSGWHLRCIRRFFGTSTLPETEIDSGTLETLARESTSRGYTVPGVQKKLSLGLSHDKHGARLTLVNYPTGYILKPPVEEYPTLPEAEQAVMCMADAAGIRTVPHALIRCGDFLAYISRRVDRMNGKKLAMEDFCQLDLRLTEDKYRGSYERCAGIVERYSAQKGVDLSELFMRLVFSYLTGNSDMHLKNFSLIETAAGSDRYVLSPAYDLLPVNLILPSDTEETALTLNGKKHNIRRKDFFAFAEYSGLSRASAEKMLQKLISLRDTFAAICWESLLPENMKTAFAELLEERMQALAR